MKKLTLIFVSFLFFAINANAELSVDDKKKIVEDIYKKIYAALGSNDIAPSFKFDTKKSRQIAYMMKDRDGNPMIGFESKAFDVCAQFGDRRDDAIALLLGHEISHHTLKHHWGKEFRSSYSIGELENEIKLVDKTNAKIFETQADENGGILCFMAGFNTSGLSEELLRKLYAAYELKDSPKYPTLEERIKIAKSQDSLVQTYIKVFETANYAMMVQNYDLAIDCFTYVERKFKSREIYNNFGVAYFLKGVAIADPDDIKYIYPVEIDLESKLSSKGSKGMGDDVKALFTSALDLFEKAVGRDQDFHTGHLNMACAYSVLGEYRKAKNKAEDVLYDADKNGDKFTIMNAKLVLAIVNDLDERGDKNKAMELLDELIDEGHLLAEANKAIMEGDDLSEIEFSKLPLKWMDGSIKEVNQPKYPKAEKISGISKYSLSTFETEEIPDEISQSITFKRGQDLLVANFETSKLYLTAQENNKYLMFHATLPSYDGMTTLGIKLGDSKSEVVKKYGSPNSVNTTKQGVILSYAKNKLLILIDLEGNVTRWIVWRELD